MIIKLNFNLTLQRKYGRINRNKLCVNERLAAGDGFRCAKIKESRLPKLGLRNRSRNQG